ncbi:DNA methyltransferase [Tenacibaculum sp. Bg11-29]|uniref:class I SAM-dependent DNA methyltransferase n=1 Tax=Tenacibaculum sp. Bg11-29 TaxID=2058306 RepID=UPI000C33F046|nr:N-6 DNA methylase [Tenacibaculum sp. Bg11-29]PKH49532.1 DNA methyltransferase [Tenacibaculum sp. Bg11-29]
MLTSKIRTKVHSLWTLLWSGGHSNPITAIEQISYLLFMKRLEVFKPDVIDEYKWSVYHKRDSKKLVSHLDLVFFYIKNDLTEEESPFFKAMRQANFSIKKPTLIEESIEIIDEIYIEIEKQEKEDEQYFQDIQGDLYEHLLKQTSEGGKNGQFRTPRHIIQMMVEMLDPDIDGKISDLACGSGGFLVAAHQYIITKYSKKTTIDINGLSKGLDGQKLNEKNKSILKNNTFYGFDIDQTMVRIGMMNLMMHGIDSPKIIHLDTLSPEYENFETENNTLKYKYILANPPFTGKINSKTISENLDRVYHPKNDKKGNRISQPVQSELLFLERIIYMLEEGGRAAVIVPEGVVFNGGKAYKETRKMLMNCCDLQGVISLPEGVFQPYTGVKTSILFFEKRKSNTESPQEMDIWFYGMNSDGYSLDANRNKLKINPLPIVIEEWESRNKKNQKNKKLQHFAIPYNEIEDNGFELNFNLYQDFIYKPENYRTPNIILKQLRELESEIFRGLEELSDDNF